MHKLYVKPRITAQLQRHICPDCRAQQLSIPRARATPRSIQLQDLKTLDAPPATDDNAAELAATMAQLGPELDVVVGGMCLDFKPGSGGNSTDQVGLKVGCGGLASHANNNYKEALLRKGHVAAARCRSFRCAHEQLWAANGVDARCTGDRTRFT